MSRAIAIKHRPRRSTCSDCGGPVWRIYPGNGAAILVDRTGNQPPPARVERHSCPKETR